MSMAPAALRKELVYAIRTMTEKAGKRLTVDSGWLTEIIGGATYELISENLCLLDALVVVKGYPLLPQHVHSCTVDKVRKCVGCHCLSNISVFEIVSANTGIPVEQLYELDDGCASGHYDSARHPFFNVGVSLCRKFRPADYCPPMTVIGRGWVVRYSGKQASIIETVFQRFEDDCPVTRGAFGPIRFVPDSRSWLLEPKTLLQRRDDGSYERTVVETQSIYLTEYEAFQEVERRVRTRFEKSAHVSGVTYTQDEVLAELMTIRYERL